MPYPSHTQRLIAKVWTMPSSSGNGTYETLQYTDASTSCNCRGWTQRVTADGLRSCKHTRMVDMGIADGEAVALHIYASVRQQTTEPKAKAATGRAVGQIGKRKMI